MSSDPVQALWDDPLAVEHTTRFSFFFLGDTTTTALNGHNIFSDAKARLRPQAKKLAQPDEGWIIDGQV